MGELDEETVFVKFYKNLFALKIFTFTQIAAFLDWRFDLNIDDEGALVEVDQLSLFVALLQ